MGVGFVSMLMMTCAAIWYGHRRFRQFWWLPAMLMLTMFYVTYAARYETALWYPYDLPHFAVFGIACLAILEGAWWPVIILFAIDLPIRETAIYLTLGVVCGRVGSRREEKGSLCCRFYDCAMDSFSSIRHARVCS